MPLTNHRICFLFHSFPLLQLILHPITLFCLPRGENKVFLASSSTSPVFRETETGQQQWQPLFSPSPQKLSSPSPSPTLSLSPSSTLSPPHTLLITTCHFTKQSPPDPLNQTSHRTQSPAHLLLPFIHILSSLRYSINAPTKSIINQVHSTQSLSTQRTDNC